MGRFAELISTVGKLWEAYYPQYIRGMGNTIALALTATVIGCLIGFICGILNTIPYNKNDNIVKRFFLKLIRIVVRAYVEVFRGTPMILQAVFIYYGIPYFTYGSVKFTGNSGIWMASLIVVSINTGAYMAESVRGGIISIDQGQFEGAKAIGMTHYQTMINVILPQAIRNIMPQIGNNLIINIKDTSVMFVIGFTEFFAVHRNISGLNYMFFESSVIEMIGYLGVTLTFSIILRLLERVMAGSESYELASADQLTMAAGTYTAPSPERLKESYDREREGGGGAV